MFIAQNLATRVIFSNLEFALATLQGKYPDLPGDGYVAVQDAIAAAHTQSRATAKIILRFPPQTLLDIKHLAEDCEANKVELVRAIGLLIKPEEAPF